MKNLKTLLEAGEKITIEFTSAGFWAEITFGESLAMCGNADLITALQKLDDICETINEKKGQTK
jgi:hypothetical protein